MRRVGLLVATDTAEPSLMVSTSPTQLGPTLTPHQRRVLCADTGYLDETIRALYQRRRPPRQATLIAVSRAARERGYPLPPQARTP